MPHSLVTVHLDVEHRGLTAALELALDDLREVVSRHLAVVPGVRAVDVDVVGPLRTTESDESTSPAAEAAPPSPQG